MSTDNPYTTFVPANAKTSKLKAHFDHVGYACEIKEIFIPKTKWEINTLPNFIPRSWFVAYVKVSKTHPLLSENEIFVNYIQVYGGITYSRTSELDASCHIFGFDTHNVNREQNFTLEDLVKMTKQFAESLKHYESIVDNKQR